MSDDKDRDQYGVLLYYKYANIPNLEDLLSFYQSNCSQLSLLGRVRLSSRGVNVTVGGKLSSLESHIEALKAKDPVFETTDFKLATCHEPLNDRVAKECGFTSLSIRIVEELVTLSSHPLLKSPEISNAGRHLSASEFHSSLQNADQKTPRDDLLLLDARNLYETRIGKFHAPNIETLDPQVRQYSDLSSWIDDNSEKLKGKHVLMYCTGGIRCEMASAYIKSKGAGFENVFQLFGGIQRYLEQFPDGGFFKGKNFVFDHRISVGSSDTDVLGTCLICHCSFDDYSSRCRCTHCRMLVLVCHNCQNEAASYVCELCQKQGKAISSMQLIDNGELKTPLEGAELQNSSSNATVSPQMPKGDDVRPSKKLRILCLHGFRQNASSFKGRTSSLAKKLKKIAEFVFVDAPHELSFIYQTTSAEDVACESSPLPSSPPPPSENCRKKYAWLVAPNFDGSSDINWKVAEGPFDPLQYQQQTDGYGSGDGSFNLCATRTTKR
ncbi:Rhodanese-like domain-containing protein 6 [Stylosanthes scabra]|uniref:Rhodanese-like domain-containing protein 6 n=1 Tax=Stylosanthes scabra TaxID=79078 RepID=A0ABU6Z1W4_9FABA|nr:Rhodanese-like domain-containing protein 6 [Stylosanthes scabra]